MTTAQSPLHRLKAQAKAIAKVLKGAERGEMVAADPKLSGVREQDSITVAVVMDDKILKITMPWQTIRETTEEGIVEYILGHMRGARDTVQ